MADNTLYGVMTLFQTPFQPFPSGNERLATFTAWIDRCAELGAQVIRLPGDWRMLEEHGDNQWARWYVDETIAVIRHAASHGIKVIYEFAQTPDWARTAGSADPVWAFPDSPAQYGRACAYLHQAFIDAGVADDVIAWEIWNEPNVRAFWPDGGYRNPAGAGDGTDIAVNRAAALQYVRLLNAAHDALHAVDPAVTVLGGSLAGTDFEYLSWMIEAGARFDGISVHPYTRPFEPSDPTPAAPTNDPTDDPEGWGQSPTLNERWSFEWGLERIHAMLVEAGLPEGLWLTEMGWRLPRNSPWVHVPNEAVQAAYLKSALELIADWDFVRAVTVFSLYDAGDGDFGLLRPNGSWRPSAHVLHDFIAALDGGTSSGEDDPAYPLPDGPGRLVGTAGDDLLIGQAWRDNDIEGRGGNDHIEAGRVGDRIDAGSGDDVIVSRDGHHAIFGNAGIDTVALLAPARSFSLSEADGRLILANENHSVTLDGVEWVVFDARGRQSGIDVAAFLGHARDITGTALDDVLSGGSSDDFIYGGDGADTLDGLAGADIMTGGAGDDRYRIDRSGDMVVELADGGTDTIMASINLSLSGWGAVENLTLTGRAVRGIGNAADNVLTGHGGFNRLSGGGGNDVIDGGGGRDILAGQGGEDRFVFAEGSGRDRIVDFRPGEDVLDLGGAHTVASFEDLADIAFASAAGHLGLRLADGSTLILAGIRQLAALSEEDVLFA